MATNDVTILSQAVDTTQYVQVFDGAAFTGGTLQVDDNKAPVRVTVAAAQPAVGIDTYFILKGEFPPLQLVNVQAGVKVWAMGHSGPAKVRFIEIAR